MSISFRRCMPAFAIAAVIAGFNTARAELSPEATFLGIPSSAGARASSKVINQHYHYDGTPGDYHLAVYMRDAMRSFGLRSSLETFTATVYTPRLLQLQLLASPVVTFDLHDEAIAADPDGSRADAGLPFNAGSANGDVRAPLVYVSRGLEADYDALARAGIGVRGRIVLVRYGAEYRGNLAARAQRHGVAGVIFYSDPKDGGSTRGPVYPNGPYRPLGAVQRGEVMGDDNLPLHVPTLPVTGQTAQRLLSEIRGTKASSAWTGGLAVAYRIGATKLLVHLHVEMNARHTTLWNTVGEITGSDPGEMVVLGAHRDAWVYGVTDDGSGISTLLEVARGLGALHRKGWTPKRSIRIAGWDAEEIGELGSAAYVAAHRSELERGCIAYLNADESASGPTFGAAAAAALAPAVTSVAQQVLRIRAPHIDEPAGGSDFESFIYAVGTPVIDLGYTGPFGTYHSPYDDLRYAALYADPGFAHHRAVAQTMGVIAMRLAQSGATAYRFQPYVHVLDDGMKTLTKSAAKANLTLAPALAAAIERFSQAARSYDTSTTRDAANALKATQLLNLLAYSANGYASVAFPRVATALAGANQANVDAAVTSTSAQLDRASALISPH